MTDTDMEAALDQELPAGWKPNEGDKLIGKVIGLSKGWSDYQEQYYPIIMIHDDETNTDVSVHAFHSALANRLMALKPEVGETIGIKMGPKVPLKRNPAQSVQTYTVKVKGRSEKIWEDMKDPRAAAATAATQAPVGAAQSDDDIPF